jgi:hypothetical protein
MFRLRAIKRSPDRCGFANWKLDPFPVVPARPVPAKRRPELVFTLVDSMVRPHADSDRCRARVCAFDCYRGAHNSRPFPGGKHHWSAVLCGRDRAHLDRQFGHACHAPACNGRQPRPAGEPVCRSCEKTNKPSGQLRLDRTRDRALRTSCLSDRGGRAVLLSDPRPHPVGGDSTPLNR